MLLPLLALLCSAFAATPVAPAVVVWVERDLPPDAARSRAAALAAPGTVTQRAWADLAFPSAGDGNPKARYSDLAGVLKDGRTRWAQFEGELDVARAVDAAITPIDVVRDDADRDMLLGALLWEGAGITLPYPEGLFASLQDTQPFRVTMASRSVVRPWVDAVAIAGDRVFARSDFPDAASFGRFLRLKQEVDLLPRAALTIDTLPAGAQVVVDGRPVDAGTVEIKLAPGHHYVHVVLGGALVGRQELDLLPGGKADVRAQVSETQLAAARTAVLSGSTEVGTAVADAIRAITAGATPTPRVFLAATDDGGKAKVLGYGGGAIVRKDRPITAILTGEIGGGIVDSSSFHGEGGNEVRAGLIDGDLGFELGIYYACVQVGASIFITPTEQIAYNSGGAGSAEDTLNTSAMVYPHAGLGVYLPRPSTGKALFLLAGKYGYLTPGTLGGAISLSGGIPIGRDTWLRFTLEGFRGAALEGYQGAGQPTSAGVLRVGFASMM